MLTIQLITKCSKRDLVKITKIKRYDEINSNNNKSSSQQERESNKKEQISLGYAYFKKYDDSIFSAFLNLGSF